MVQTVPTLTLVVQVLCNTDNRYAFSRRSEKSEKIFSAVRLLVSCDDDARSVRSECVFTANARSKGGLPMPDFVVGDVIRWRGLHGHEGVIVGLSGRSADVLYAGAPDAIKDARLSDLQLATGPIPDDVQQFIDSTVARWIG
jgi:hypothetical protein